MKVFLLIHEQDTDAAWGANVDPFISLEAAQAAMQKSCFPRGWTPCYGYVVLIMISSFYLGRQSLAWHSIWKEIGKQEPSFFQQPRWGTGWPRILG